MVSVGSARASQRAAEEIQIESETRQLPGSRLLTTGSDDTRGDVEPGYRERALVDAVDIFSVL